MATSPTGTGINPWWTYDELDVPGGGHAMVNVGTGNLVLQADDVVIPHKGISLAFRRTYNLQSGHDVAGTDGTPAGMFGNGWTNTLDAHIAPNAAGGWSIYDIDGARYDYTPDGSGNFVAPAGQHATLTSDGGCGWFWTKKTGTRYYFYGYNTPLCAGRIAPAFYGRLYQLIGRNANTNITLAYSFDNGYTGSGAKVSTIVATTESGQSLTLTFGDFNGYRLLKTLLRPDGVGVAYGYDAQGDLTTVTAPPNNSGGVGLSHCYGYAPSSSATPALLWASSPRWTASSGTDGGYLRFAYSFGGPNNALGRTNEIDHLAFVDGTPPDGTSTPLQLPMPASSSAQAPFLVQYYSLGAIGTASSATYRDTDGRYANWVTDAAGRLTQTQECTATQSQQCTGVLIVDGKTWDANNNMTAEVDGRGYETDYAYDRNGNTVAVAEPATAVQRGTSTSVQIRPTKRFDYDASNNIVAYCDERANLDASANWTGPTSSDAVCSSEPSSVPHTSMSYVYPQYEPYGEQTGIVTPMGYHRTIAYSPSSQQGTDFGLPTNVMGDSVVQMDGTTHQSTSSLQYDSAGNIVAYGNGIGSWSLKYNGLNELTSATDPDGVSAYRTYFTDGTLSTSATAHQQALGLPVSYSYDLDGNVTHEVRHHGCTVAASCTAGDTTKWYDGADRLVEVQQPQSTATDFYSFPWRTRYLYDLTGGGTVNAAGVSGQAYGGLFKTQEFLGSSVTPQWSETGSTGNTPGSWQDVAGTTFDALGRPVEKVHSSATGGPRIISNTYDVNNPGYLSKSCNGLNTDSFKECHVYAYDERGLSVYEQFNVASSPAMQFLHDAVGHVTSSSSANGSTTVTYDAAGNPTQRVQTVAGSNAPPATVTYHYYTNGMRSAVDIAAATSIPSALSYSYRNDDKLTTLGAVGSNTFRYSYSNAGRVTQRVDPGSATTSFSYDANGEASAFSGPALSETGIAHDAEAEIVSALPSWIGRTVTATYSPRGELVSELYSSWSGVPSLMANGVRISAGKTLGTTYSKTASATFDAAAAVPSEIVSATDVHGNYTDTTFAYDFAGRLTTKSVAARSYNNPESDSGDTKSYDADNHLVADGNGAGSSFSYAWGPTGHPYQITQVSGSSYPPTPTSTSRAALFWDDADLLFVTNDAGQIDDVKIGGLADYLPTGLVPLTIWDRDTTGQLIGCHNASGTGSLSVGAFRFQTRTNCTSTSSSNATFWAPTVGFPSYAYAPPSSGINIHSIVVALRSDGFYDGLNTIQGVRSYDSDAGVWTAPDAYSGDVHDPMSQKPYMWNRNNPYTYSDPTGYSSQSENMAIESYVLEGQLSMMEIAQIRQMQNKSRSQAVQDRLPEIKSRMEEGKYPTGRGASGGPGTGKKFSRAQKKAVQKTNECAACGRRDIPIQGDHVIPKTRGGNNSSENLDPLCGTCNASKGAQTPGEWLQQLFPDAFPPSTAPAPAEAAPPTNPK